MAIYKPLICAVGAHMQQRPLCQGKKCFVLGLKQFRSTEGGGFGSTKPKKGLWPNKNVESPILQQAESPFKNFQMDNSTVGVHSLWKPFFFTVAFSTTSIGACAIWQYENMRKKALSLFKMQASWASEKLFQFNKKNYTWRQELNKMWSRLTEGEKLFVPICFINTLVFLAWKVPRFQPTMIKYFCSNSTSKAICWPMVLSTFSHYSALHLFANMYVLHSFSSGAVSTLGKEQFLGLYLAAGVISSFTSVLHRVITSKPHISLGASGAIMAVLGYVCTQHPQTELSIIMLPMFTFTAGNAIKFILGVDILGVLCGFRFLDHAAHLGGALCGIAWCHWGNTYIWQNREPFLHWWHEIRTQK